MHRVFLFLFLFQFQTAALTGISGPPCVELTVQYSTPTHYYKCKRKVFSAHDTPLHKYCTLPLTMWSYLKRKGNHWEILVHDRSTVRTVTLAHCAFKL